ncbi:MAG: DMT family transporter, partial [Candidatus Heimdallarchaeota archaeon]|nr:DMT family transporter [Candidatus Heimdallarchaeota archaeon]
MDEHNKAAVKALLVTFLWSSSWVLIKFGLKDIPPLYFASLRYLIAGFLLLGFSLLHPSTRSNYNQLTKKWLINLLFYGIVFISFTQGLQFVSLKIFPAITLSFVLNFTTIIVILFSIPILRETPNKNQVILIVLAMLAGVLFFYPFDFSDYPTSGYLLLVLILLSNALSSIIGRKINKLGTINPVVITSISMCFGA